MTTTHSALTLPKPARVASRRHTAVVIAVFLLLAALGFQFQHTSHAAPPPHANVVALYLSLIVMEWGLVFLVWRGLKANGTSLRELVGRRWATRSDVVRDLAIGVAMWGAWRLSAYAWTLWWPDALARSIQTLLPQGPIEIALWIVLSCSAAFAEEVVFRGYLLRQAWAFLGNGVIAVIIQAAVFGIAHAYQGVAACAKIFLYGALLGAVALWRRSLRPGILAHAWTDIAAGILRV